MKPTGYAADEIRRRCDPERFIIGDCCGSCGKMLPKRWWIRCGLDVKQLPCGHPLSHGAMKTGVRWINRKTGQVELTEP